MGLTFIQTGFGLCITPSLCFQDMSAGFQLRYRSRHRFTLTKYEYGLFYKPFHTGIGLQVRMSINPRHARPFFYANMRTHSARGGLDVNYTAYDTQGCLEPYATFMGQKRHN